VWADGAAPVTPRDSIIGAAAGYLSLLERVLAFKLLPARKAWATAISSYSRRWVRGSGGRCCCPSSMFASAVGALCRRRDHHPPAQGKDTQIAFGPFLAIAGWLALIFRQRRRRAISRPVRPH
jgi:leader peptidase (prepilin peptidase)/N-methyltransferase